MIRSVPETILDPGAFRAELGQLYEDLNHDLARLGPVCRLSGRCCRFREFGHTLFVSAAEFSLLLADAPPPVRPLDEGATCPWQDAAGRCTAREARPLGCRVFYCDQAFDGHAEPLSEAYIGRLKRLTEAHRLPWHYAPLHDHLRAAQTRGHFLASDGPSQPPAEAAGAVAQTDLRLTLLHAAQ